MKFNDCFKQSSIKMNHTYQENLCRGPRVELHIV